MNPNKGLLLPALLVCSGDCLALDWLLKPEFSTSERYDDNITMQVVENAVIDSLITTLSPGVLLGYQTEHDDLKTRFKWNELIYHNQSDLDFSEKMLNTSYLFQGERFKTGLDGSYNEQSSINTQLDDAGSGRLLSRLTPQTTRSISPNILFNLSERNSLQLVYNYQDVAFQRPAGLTNLNYMDYNSQQLSATGYHVYSPRLTLNLTGSYSLFESGGTSLTTISATTPSESPVVLNQFFSQKSTTFFYQAGMQYAIDELTQLSLAAGMRNTTNDTQQYYSDPITGEIITEGFLAPYRSSGDAASGHVFSASFNRTTEWGNFSFNAGQQLNPSSSGQQQQTTNFSAQARYNITERLNTGLSISRLISESSSTLRRSSQSFNRTFTTVSPNIQWRWTPEINLQLSYSHREQEYTDTQQSAAGNNIQLMFSYQPQINRQVK